ncbi:MAG: restriction endonuclease [Planctomycetota bacterium]|nr:MAG: restriction endonuclease [Planctomycetota bacterium]
MNAGLRELVWRRAESRCEYCRVPYLGDKLPFEIDHIIASKHQGPTTQDNLALCCFSCNVHKGPNIAGIDPETGEIVPLFHPRHDRWLEHFDWHGAVILGRTPKGRATIDVLLVNDPDRISQREALIASGDLVIRGLPEV